MDLGDGGKFVYDQRNLALVSVEADRGRQALLLSLAIPFLDCFFRSWRFLLRQRVLYLTACFSRCSRASLTADLHVAGLRLADQRAVARADGDFGFVAALFDGQDHLGFKLVAQNFADFGQAGFD